MNNTACKADILTLSRTKTSYIRMKYSKSNIIEIFNALSPNYFELKRKLFNHIKFNPEENTFFPRALLQNKKCGIKIPKEQI